MELIEAIRRVLMSECQLTFDVVDDGVGTLSVSFRGCPETKYFMSTSVGEPWLEADALDAIEWMLRCTESAQHTAYVQRMQKKDAGTSVRLS